MGAMVKEAVRQRPAESFMEKNEHDAHPDTLIRKVVAIMPAVSFDEVSGFHFSDIVAQLVYGVLFFRKAISLEDGLMDLTGCPSLDLTSCV